MKENDGLRKNIVFLFITKFSGYLLPLLAIPYLARVLEPTEFGRFSVAQSMAILLSILIEYGFSLSATRDVATQRTDPKKLSNIAQQVNSAKMILSATALGLALLSTEALPQTTSMTFAIGAWMYALAIGVSPSWYYQGIEKLQNYTILDTGGKTLSLILVFTLINTPEDANRVVYLLALGPLITALIAYRQLHKKIQPQPFCIRQATNGLKSGLSMFIFRAAISLYTAANVFVLGLFATPAATGFYAATEKLVRGASSMIGPISQAMYPKMALLAQTDPIASVRLIQRALVALTALSILGCLATYYLAEQITSLLLGPGYEPVSEMLKTMIWIAPLIAVGNVLGIQWMLPLKMDKAFNLTVITAGIFSIVGATLVAPRWGAQGMIFINLASEFLVVLLLAAILKKSNALPLIKQPSKSKHGR